MTTETKTQPPPTFQLRWDAHKDEQFPDGCWICSDDFEAGVDSFIGATPEECLAAYRANY